MPSITINGNDYSVYADIDSANEYLAADFTAAAWQASADTDKKGRALATAKRILDRVNWAGSKTDEDQADAFPRSGIDGQDEDEVPDGIVSANIELARYIFDGSDVLNGSSGTNKIKSQRAGSVAVEYVSPALLDSPTRFPLPVQELVSRFLGGTAVVTPFAGGTDGCSFTDEPFQPSTGF